MTLIEQIERDLTQAMKQKQELKLSVVRMMKSALKLKQVEMGHAPSDAETQAVLRTLVKQRRESAAMFRQGGREDLAAKEEAEVVIIEGYLPAAATDHEIDEAVAFAFSEVNPKSPQEMGKVMKAAIAKLAGKNVDGKRVSEKVKARLGG